MKIRLLTYRHQNTGQNHILYVAITYLEILGEVRVFQKSNKSKSHCIHWEIKSWLYLRNSDSNLEGLGQRTAYSNSLWAALFRVQTPLGKRDFLFSAHVQTDPGPGTGRWWRGVDQPPPSGADVQNEQIYFSTPYLRLPAWYGTPLPLPDYNSSESSAFLTSMTYHIQDTI
jgi:hypothetical protein